MDKDRKMFIGIILLLLVSMILIGAIAFKSKKGETIDNIDAINFKNEYESLNGTVRESDGKANKNITIAEDNPIKYLTEEEAINLLETGTGIIYFGFSECPWCRTLLPVLLQTLDNMSIDRLYYVNLSKMRDTLSLSEDNKVIVKEEGTKGYYRMLEILDNYLEPFYLTNKEGEKIDTLEKRIMAPTLVFVKDGELKGIHVGTVDSQKSGFDELSTEEQENLQNILMDLIRKVYSVDCDDAC